MIEIRNAMPGEIGDLAKLGLAAWRKGIMPLVPRDTVERTEKANPFVPFLEKMGSRVLVAVVGDRLAGIAACEHSDDYISDVWVAPAFEGRGVASALIRALEGEIVARGFASARIHVAAANDRARGLYDHLGYRETARRTAFDPVLETTLEKIELAKDLVGAAPP
ncbi:MAG: GNAT family N-acetyltransferase [Rhizobiaceae bacterium]|nr:GNAT family N-acetyltransferase [Rhizobiaceae bacterium]